MNRVDRRGFLKLAGTGSAAVAAASLPGSTLLPAAAVAVTGAAAATTFSFRAIAGLPASPASMATRIVEGHVDPVTGTGMVTSRVLAGHPSPSQIALPGLTRLIRINAVAQEGSVLRLQGVVDDRSQLLAGESPHVELVIDSGAGTLIAPVAGHRGTLTLQ